MQKHVLIVAGGSGSRMGSDVPKQMLPLCGVPIIIHTIRCFVEALGDHIKPVIVCNKQYMLELSRMMLTYLPGVRHSIMPGGATRFESVKFGLDLLSNESGLVAIHDAVRPLTDVNVILDCYKVAHVHGAAVAAVKSKDSIRLGNEKQSNAVDRSTVWLIQTPQVFDVTLINEAYGEVAFTDDLTDDASVFERHGGKVTLVNSTYGNIKITTPEDMLIAEQLMLLNRK